MVVPVTGTIPDSTLSPFQVRQKFSPQTLAGLGDEWCTGGSVCTVPYYSDGSDGLDPGTQIACGGCTTDYTGGPTTTYTPTTSQGTATQSDGTCWPFDPSCGGGTPVTSGATVSGGPYVATDGSIVTTYSDGTYSRISSTGQVTSGRSVVGSVPSPGSGSITQAQANAWPQMINALAAAGVRLGTVALLPAGASLLPNGTIVGNGQSVFSGGTSINSSFAAILTNPVFLIGGFGVLALLALPGRR